MSKIIAHAAVELVAVIAVEPLRFNKERHMPGARVEGLTQEQANALFAIGHAKPAETNAEPSAAAGKAEAEAEAGAEKVASEKAEADQTATSKVSTDQDAVAKPATAKTTAKKR